MEAKERGLITDCKYFDEVTEILSKRLQLADPLPTLEFNRLFAKSGTRIFGKSKVEEEKKKNEKFKQFPFPFFSFLTISFLPSLSSM
jgi:hypothetical protein